VSDPKSLDLEPIPDPRASGSAAMPDLKSLGS